MIRSVRRLAIVMALLMFAVLANLTYLQSVSYTHLTLPTKRIV